MLDAKASLHKGMQHSSCFVQSFNAASAGPRWSLPCWNTNTNPIASRLLLTWNVLLADKLSETKKAEREAKEAHKAALQASKQKNQDVSNKQLNAVLFLRHYSNGFS